MYLYFLASPAISNTAPTFTKLHFHSLGYEADYYVGIGADGSVLLGRSHPDRLLLYQFSTSSYTQLWDKPCLDGVGYHDHKCVMGRGQHQRLLLRDVDGRNPPREFSRDLQLEAQHDVEVGKLCGVLPGERAVYLNEDGLLLYRGAHLTGRIRPPPGASWSSQWLSVAGESSTGWTAVTDYHKDTLDIYNGAGQFALTYYSDTRIIFRCELPLFP